MVIILVMQVNDARRYGDKVHIVTPDWLWSCSERWERVRHIYLLFILLYDNFPRLCR